MGTSEPTVPLRVDADVIRRFLDQLDEQSPRGGLEARAAPRFRYRPERLTVELPATGLATVRRSAAARNLSRTGVAFLTGQFIYPQTPCRVTLYGLHGHTQTTHGRVVRCRYLLGSGTLYEVGVHFAQPIDVTLFAASARQIRILAVDAAPEGRELVAGLLAGQNVILTAVPEAAAALQAAESAEFDLVLIDLEREGLDAFALTRALRERGYLGPIIGLAVQTGPELRERCAAAGCTGYLPRPVTRDSLGELLDSLSDEPVVSDLAHDSDLAPLIDRFVAGLRAQARAISAAFERGDSAEVHRLAVALRGEAGSYGFPAISEEAEQVQALAALDTPAERLRPAVYELIHLCLAARPAAVPQ